VVGGNKRRSSVREQCFAGGGEPDRTTITDEELLAEL
jgi:hypothetical protein